MLLKRVKMEKHTQTREEYSRPIDEWAVTKRLTEQPHGYFIDNSKTQTYHEGKKVMVSERETLRIIKSISNGWSEGESKGTGTGGWRQRNREEERQG